MSGHVYCVCVYRSAAAGNDLLLWVYLTCGQLHCVYDLLPSSTGSISRGEKEVEVALYPAFMARGGVMAERMPGHLRMRKVNYFHCSIILHNDATILN